MAQPASRQEFIDYCKRQLGAPVLEINVADEQVEDIVDDAILPKLSEITIGSQRFLFFNLFIILLLCL